MTAPSEPLAATTARTAAKLHEVTTPFHAFIYFADEAAEEYAKLGLTGRSGYFASRTAAMGPLPAEMVTATFYNFSPTLVTIAMEGVWDTVDAPTIQIARWAAVKRALDAAVRPVLTPEAIDEALELTTRCVNGLAWAGRPLAAGNAAQLRALADSTMADDDLLRLWQMVTIMREWRGDAHIGLLVAEPLDGAECTVISDILSPAMAGMVRTTRAWNDTEWDAALERLAHRGFYDGEGALTDDGLAMRTAIERRTNDLARSITEPIGEAGALRLRELLDPARTALVAANYFARIGQPAPQQD